MRHNARPGALTRLHIAHIHDTMPSDMGRVPGGRQMDYALDDGLRSLQRRARIAVVLCIAVIVFKALQVVEVCIAMIAPDLLARLGLTASRITTLDAITVGFFIASAIAVAMWIHRAHANLDLFGLGGLEFTPGWSVGWFFIPFANLVMPFRAMKELWNRSFSHDGSLEPPQVLLVLWWAGNILNNILSNVGVRLPFGPFMQTILLCSFIAMILSAACLIQIIRRVTALQNQSSTIGAVFA